MKNIEEKIINQTATLDEISQWERYVFENFSSIDLDKVKILREKAEEIMQIRQFGIANLGISGTPSFVISSIKGREIIYGAPDYETFDALIRKYMPENKK